MNYCKQCGKEINNNSKFCPNCGTPINSFSLVEDEYEDISPLSDDYEEDFIEYKAPKKKKNKMIVAIIVFALLVVAVSGGIFAKVILDQKEKLKESIEITNVDVTNYPSIVVSIKANNYTKSLDVKNFTLKENDTFQKNLSLNMELEGNDYKISYKTSDESKSGDRNIKVSYSEDDHEVVVDGKYTAPKKSNDSIATSDSSNNVVNTYDNNEVAIKQAIDNYEKSYIRMVNSKDTYYIRDAIDLSGGLMSEFTNTIKSYSEQGINEDLMDYKIEKINKINDQQYEVTNYEKFYISYNKEKKSLYTDFRTVYVLSKTSTGFKVYSMKNIDNLGNK